MNWDAVGAISEIVGVVAIIASLIYVAIQIRQNTDIARATIVHETSVSFSRFHELLSADAELAGVYIRGVKGEELTEIETRRFISLIEITMAYLEDVDHQYKSDLYFDEEDDIDLICTLRPRIGSFLPRLSFETGGSAWLRIQPPPACTSRSATSWRIGMRRVNETA